MSKDTLDKAYGSIPKEVGINLDVNWVPTWRGLKYYTLVLIRKFTR